MSDLFWSLKAQMRRIKPYFPLWHGVPRFDNWRIISGIIFVIRNGLRSRDALPDYGPPQTIFNRFIRWSRTGVFNRIFASLPAKGGKPDHLMINVTHLKAHRTAGSHFKKGPVPRRIGRTKDCLNSKLHAACDGQGRPLILLLSECQMNDYKGAALMINAFPKAKVLLFDRGYDADRFRRALIERSIAPCIPSKSNCKIPIQHGHTLYRRRHCNENMFEKRKRVVTHHGRVPAKCAPSLDRSCRLHPA